MPAADGAGPPGGRVRLFDSGEVLHGHSGVLQADGQECDRLHRLFHFVDKREERFEREIADDKRLRDLQRLQIRGPACDWRGRRRSHERREIRFGQQADDLCFVKRFEIKRGDNRHDSRGDRCSGRHGGLHGLHR